MSMSTNSGSREEPRRRVRDALEETFARYEPREEAPPIPRVEEGVRAEERPPERVAPRAEVKAPSMVRTGIASLDMILGGGIPDHSLVLVLGEPGSNDETFVRQLLYNHTYGGGKVAYYLAETLSTDIRQDMERFGWNLKEYLARGNWFFINMRTQELQQLADLSPRILSEGFSINLTRGLDGLKTDLLSKIKEERWTILELSHLLQQYDLREITSLILYWRAAIRIYGGLHFVLLPLGVHAENTLNSLKHLSDGVLEFRLREGPREYENLMSVTKLRGLRRPLMITFTVEEAGITIETAARIA